MMPPGGGPERGEQLGDAGAHRHERATGEELGAWLDGARGTPTSATLDRDLVRLARRDWDRARRVPDRARRRAGPGGAPRARTPGRRRAPPTTSPSFAPALERNVELARAYAACFDGFARPLRRAAGRLRLRPDRGAHQRSSARSPRRCRRSWPRRARRCPRPRALDVPVAAQRGGGRAACSRASASTPASWRIDVSAHPFPSHRAARQPRHDALRGRRARVACSPRCTSSATRSTSARSRPSWRARTSAAARRCRSTSPRASCGRTTSAATRRSRRSSPRS